MSRASESGTAATQQDDGSTEDVGCFGWLEIQALYIYIAYHLILQIYRLVQKDQSVIAGCRNSTHISGSLCVCEFFKPSCSRLCVSHEHYIIYRTQASNTLEVTEACIEYIYMSTSAVAWSKYKQVQMRMNSVWAKFAGSGWSVTMKFYEWFGYIMKCG